ncbi:hypothetical protein MMC31_006863, partial [Peltigera leucophlebia]|nr:hypothetical protein [Peltigera leucophlebia]
MTTEKSLSSLELVSRVDSWPYFSRDAEAYRKQMKNYYYFMIEGFEKPFGYAYSDFVKETTWSSVWSLDHEKRILKLHSPNDFEQRTQHSVIWCRK